MFNLRNAFVCLVALVASQFPIFGQQAPASSVNLVVPPLIEFSGIATDQNGNSLDGSTNIRFSLYTYPQGGEALWSETQNVQLDATGHYSVQLGITKSTGVPISLFTQGQAHWLGVQIAGYSEQPRIFLVSVPYALKAGDAATVGGFPPSAFVLAGPNGANSTSAITNTTVPAPTINAAGTGTTDFIPLWVDNSGDLGNSALFQSGTSPSAKVGINTATPATALDVKGSATIRGASSMMGTLTLPATGTATASAGKTSQAMVQTASAFNGTAAVAQTFQWQAEPANNNTSSASGTLNLLFGSGTTKPTETGLKVASNGQLTFAKGQTFPGTGSGTVTSVGSGAGLTGGPITGSGTLSIASGGITNSMLANPSITVTPGTALTGGGTVSLGGTTTLNLDTTQVPLLNAPNFFIGTQTVIGGVTAAGNVSATGNVTATGTVSANAFYDSAGTQVLSISPGLFNLYVGQSAGQGAGSNNTGSSNATTGYQTLFSNTSGSNNSAFGADALYSNTTGSQNTAVGENAIPNNSTGGGNTGLGLNALFSNTTGGTNTGLGDGALYGNSTGSNNTASGFLSGGIADGSGLTGSSNTFLGTLSAVSTGTLSNATAIGANAEVATSNALVLGSINGVNGATASTNVGIGTTAPAYSLDVHGTGNFTGLVSFAPNQTFPGTGTITGVTAGTGLTGGGGSGAVTLNIDTTKVVTGVLAGTDLTGGGTGGVQTINLDTTKVPLLAAANTFNASQTVNGNLSATGVVTGSGFQIGSNLFDYGSYANANVFLGFAGNA